jgi:hypothetical protein
MAVFNSRRRWLLGAGLTALGLAVGSIRAATRPTDVQLDALAEAIGRNAGDPAQFVVDQFRSADLVLLSEDHAVREVLDFVSALIPRLHRAGVFQIGMEFGAQERQASIDAVLSASRYDEQEVRDALWDYNVGWAYVEYQDVVRAAWAFNRSLSAGQTAMRIVNLSYRYEWRHFTRRDDPVGMARVFHRGAPDHFRADVVGRETLAAGQKMLLLVGMPHGHSRFRPGRFDPLARDFCRHDTEWLGQLLLQRAPGRVRTLLFHQPWPGRDGRPVLPAGGWLDAALARLGDTPCGFDLKADGIGTVRDHSGLAVCYTQLSLADVADGYLFLAPLRRLHGCRIDERFFDGHTWEETRQRLPDPDWHGTIASLEAWKAKVRDFADVKQRYAAVLATSISNRP